MRDQVPHSQKKKQAKFWLFILFAVYIAERGQQIVNRMIANIPLKLFSSYSLHEISNF